MKKKTDINLVSSLEMFLMVAKQVIINGKIMIKERLKMPDLYNVIWMEQYRTLTKLSKFKIELGEVKIRPTAMLGDYTLLPYKVIWEGVDLSSPNHPYILEIPIYEREIYVGSRFELDYQAAMQYYWDIAQNDILYYIGQKWWLNNDNEWEVV
jgi:hypothetical protein